MPLFLLVLLFLFTYFLGSFLGMCRANQSFTFTATLLGDTGLKWFSQCRHRTIRITRWRDTLLMATHSVADTGHRLKNHFKWRNATARQLKHNKHTKPRASSSTSSSSASFLARWITRDYYCCCTTRPTHDPRGLEADRHRARRVLVVVTILYYRLTRRGLRR